MQPVYDQPNSRNIALQYGLIAGLILAVVASAILLINTFVNTSSIGSALLLSSLSFLLGLVAYFVVGIMAAKKTGKVNTGTLAGLWAGAAYGVIGLIVSMGLFFGINLPKLITSIQDASPSTNIDAFRTGAIAGGVGVAIFGLAFAIGLGAGLGALGGLIGKSTSNAVPAPVPGYANPPYPGQPYPSQPYPPQPYPGQPYPSQPYPPQPYQGQQPYEQ